MKRFVFVFLAVFVLLTGSAFSQQAADLFKEERSAALYIDVAAPYQAAIEFLKQINDPQNQQFKQKFDQLFTVAHSNFAAARNMARSKACSANMRVLLGAAEMYNMDNPVGMSSKLDVEKLVQGKYLKSAPTCPEGGSYSVVGDLTGTGDIQCSIHGTVKDLKVGGSKADNLDFQSFVAKIIEFDRQELFKPTGGLYLIGEPPDVGGFAMLLQAQCKPKELLVFLRETLGLTIPDPQEKPDGSLSFKILAGPLPTGKNPELQLSSRGIFINAFNGASKSDSKHWDTFLQTANKDGNSLVVEVLPQYFASRLPASGGSSSTKACAANMRVILGAVEMFNMDAAPGKEMKRLDFDPLLQSKYLLKMPSCPNGGKYGETGDLSGNGLICCSIHNTVEDLKVVDLPSSGFDPLALLKKIMALRLIVGEKNSLLAAGIQDANDRKNVADLLKAQVPVIKSQLLTMAAEKEKQASGQLSELDKETMAQLKSMVDSLSFFEKGEWCGIRGNGVPRSHLVAPVMGILAAIAIPNFRQARTDARQKACFANQRVLMGAMEMFAMDNPEPMKQLDIGRLVAEKYLRSAPECPDGGVYSADFKDAFDFKIKCSVHGSVEEN